MTSELEIENDGDSFEFILDHTDINFSNIIEPVEPVVIAVPTSTQAVNLHEIPGASNNIESPSSKNLKNTLKKKKDILQIRRKWKKITVKTLDPDYSLPDGPVDGKFTGETATSIFLDFIDGFIDQLVYQTNLYSVQRGYPLNIKRFEILNFIGIHFLMGYNKLPSWKHYWATSDDLNVPRVSNTMSRNRFDNILSNLHVQNNLLIPKNNKDKLFKLRPLINYCNEIFSTSYHGTRELSIDESMIIFKGRNCMKQYNPQKPIKRGYKIWCLSDQRGYIKNLSVYQGKDEQLSDEFESFGLGECVVLHLTKNEWNKNKTIFFDNYFTSLLLLEKLKAENSLACGTIRSNRKDVPDLAEDKKAPRGSSDYRITNTGIGVYKWKDTKFVMLASNYHSSEITTVTRKDNFGRKKDILCPQVVRDYNCYMGGVDHADQLRTTYGVNRKSKKWWHRIFWGLLDIMFVNSYVVYKQIHGSITLLDFRRSVTQGLLT